MQYFLKRGDQKYGPYSLSDLQSYLQAGNIVATDLAQSEGMNDWASVSQILGNIPGESITGGAAAAPALEPQLVPLPPNLHWAIVLVLDIVTRQLFNLIWVIVQANWARKLINNNKSMVLVAMYPAGILSGILIAAIERSMAGLAGIFIIGGLVAYLVGIFSIKHAMEEYYNSTENIGLRLSGVMTFFFSSIYIQFHINKIARWKKTGVLV